MRRGIGAALLVVSSAAICPAASGAGEDSSNIFVGIFIAMVGLMVAVLLVPAAKAVWGLIRSTEERAEPAGETSSED